MVPLMKTYRQPTILVTVIQQSVKDQLTVLHISSTLSANCSTHLPLLISRASGPISSSMLFKALQNAFEHVILAFSE
jgi:hypothetical protein